MLPEKGKQVIFKQNFTEGTFRVCVGLVEAVWTDGPPTIHVRITDYIQCPRHARVSWNTCTNLFEDDFSLYTEEAWQKLQNLVSVVRENLAQIDLLIYPSLSVEAKPSEKSK